MKYKCRNCGSQVPARVGRVAGDNDHCTPVCPDCVGDEATRWEGALAKARDRTRARRDDR